VSILRLPKRVEALGGCRSGRHYQSSFVLIRLLLTLGSGMRNRSLNSAVPPSTSPAEAYARDLERLRRTGPLGPTDDAWLMLAHTLNRCVGISDEVVEQMAPAAADLIAVAAVASGLAGESGMLRAARALSRLDNAESRALRGDDPVVAELAKATQAVAEEMELAGAFELAYATLSSVLHAFSARMAPRAQGNVLAQLGRAARQLAATDVAREMYEEALTIGHQCDAADVVARAQLGFGVLGLTLGNYRCPGALSARPAQRGTCE